MADDLAEHDLSAVRCGDDELPAKGANNGQIQLITGQASDSTTNRYGKSQSIIENSADKINGVGF